MLDKAVPEVEANKTDALAKFDGGFKDRNLYPFCGGPDGNFIAHPTLTGKSLKDRKDKAGTPLGEEIYKTASGGKVSEVNYRWPRPGHHGAGAEGKLLHPGRRSDLRRRLLQMMRAGRLRLVKKTAGDTAVFVCRNLL